MQAEIADDSDLKWVELSQTDNDDGSTYRGWAAHDNEREFIIIYSPVLGYSLGWCKKGDPFHLMYEIGVDLKTPEAAKQKAIEHRRNKFGN